MEVIIDRFEGEYAVVELNKGVFVNLPKALVPDAKENDVIQIIVNKKKTNKRKEHITKLMDNLFQD